MATFKPDELIGKTLIAKENVSVYRILPKSVLEIPVLKGKVIGVITGWRKDEESKNCIWLMPNDMYVAHDVNSLTING